MTSGQIVNSFRIEMSEPDPTGRWSNADALDLANTAQLAVGLRVEYPEGTLTLSPGTVANQQEYGLPEINEPLRVYLAGQPLVQTTIPNLEGYQIELYDQTATGFIPQWKYQAAVSYPVSSQTGYPFPSGLPYWPGVRPQYYMRGGNIGIVPAPSGVYSLVIDILPIPPAMNNVALTDNSIFPVNFKEAIVWKMCALAHKADNDDEQANYADMQFERQVGVLQTWKRRLDGENPNKLMLYPHRANWTGPYC